MGDWIARLKRRTNCFRLSKPDLLNNNRCDRPLALISSVTLCVKQRRGTDYGSRDFDLPIDELPGATLYAMNKLQQDELEFLLCVYVDLLTPADMPSKLRERVLAESRPA